MRFIVALLLLAPSVAVAQAEVSPSDILADATWMEAYDAYHPGYGLMAALKGGLSGGVSIRVYFADWCEDSQQEVPRFIKLVDELESPDLEVHYMNGIEHKAEGQKFYVEEQKVERLPTFIVTRNGREIGRIVEHPKDSFVEDLLEMVY